MDPDGHAPTCVLDGTCPDFKVDAKGRFSGMVVKQPKPESLLDQIPRTLFSDSGSKKGFLGQLKDGFVGLIAAPLNIEASLPVTTTNYIQLYPGLNVPFPGMKFRDETIIKDKVYDALDVDPDSTATQSGEILSMFLPIPLTAGAQVAAETTRLTRLTARIQAARAAATTKIRPRTPAPPANGPILFRGTSDGFAGSPGAQRVGITPTSTDPVVATAFATHSDEFGRGLVQIARPSDLGGVKTYTGYLPYESEVGVELLPLAFAARASTTVPSAQARSALAKMGVGMPSRIGSPADLTTFLRGRAPLTPSQVRQFLENLR